MYHHLQLGNTPMSRRRQLALLVRSGAVTLGGYKKARIYGTLHCRAGKRMKAANRVFFKDEAEALRHGYRPCAVCLPEKYRRWKVCRKGDEG